MHCIDMLPLSLLKEKLTGLAALFEDADRAVLSFTATADFGCTPGCGRCCQGFIPDLLPLEASYIASFLVSSNKAAAESMLERGMAPLESFAAGPTCPLYRDGTPYHCSVYEARPLVCRLFGFSGVLDKYGDLSFSLCRYMEAAGDSNGERKFGILQDDARFPVKPPAMSFYGDRLQSLDPDNSDKRILLHEAVPAAIAHVLFLASLKTGIKAMDDTPLPAAFL